ncbi:MAG: ATP-binding cassette domain-containing protein [Microbacteriaceae bacterium]|nr:ATP-binding cassette domain-containing protein [Microbacteriaceae bacterium]
MIRFEAVTFTHSGAQRPVFTNLNLEVPEGELCLVTGATGTGKSTLLQLVNGLAPHFTGGALEGRVLVGGRDTRSNPPRRLADLVGTVGQVPAAGFVTDRVDEELAYVLEQLGTEEGLMRSRVEETIDLLGLEDLRERPLRELSGGEQQRVAIGSVLAAHPKILVLDEPTSALDPIAAEEVLAAIVRLVHDLGITVLLAEHRLERVIQFADSIVLIEADGTVRHSSPEEILESSPVAPPVIRLGRLAGWDPLPLSVRDARRKAAPLRERLQAPTPRARKPQPPSSLEARGITVKYGPLVAVNKVDLDLRRSEIAAVMGRNGSGKSSLLWALQGSGALASGTVAVLSETGAALNPRVLAPSEAAKLVALVPQDAADLLYLGSVAAECADSDSAAGCAPGDTRKLLDRLSPGIDPSSHPRDLSEGQRLALVLAIQLAGRPRVLLLDEPTRGLDYEAKARLGALLADLASEGVSVLLSSHDVEFVARVADRVLLLAGGELISDGEARKILTSSSMLAPQVSKILAPLALLTVEEVQSLLVKS